MELKPVSIDPKAFPPQLQPLLHPGLVYDSSCSGAAKVWYVPQNGGIFVKQSEKGTLAQEAAMTRFFHTRQLGPPVLEYISADQDWLVTQALPGQDCISKVYLEDPKRLSQTLGQLLRILHDTDPTGCPVQNRTQIYVRTAAENHRSGRYDASLFPDNWGYRSAGEAWATVERCSEALRCDTLIHGDYCLPNILLDDWKFSGFIDVGGGGLGDRHMDLFWGIWSLNYNLKTDAYTQRFLDAYGRDQFDPQILKAIGAFEVFS